MTPFYGPIDVVVSCKCWRPPPAILRGLMGCYFVVVLFKQYARQCQHFLADRCVQRKQVRWIDYGSKKTPQINRSATVQLHD